MANSKWVAERDNKSLPSVRLHSQPASIGYPTQTDFEQAGQRVGEYLSQDRNFSDDRVMRRQDGDLSWVRVRGFTYTPEEAHSHTLWVFTEIAKNETPGQSLRTSLTPRERDIAALMFEGKTGKEGARALDISPRTVDVYRRRLLRKYDAPNGSAHTTPFAGIAFNNREAAVIGAFSKSHRLYKFTCYKFASSAKKKRTRWRKRSP
ncbi:LuxR family transcriptional regulator (plasmid) [Rhizobium beringeri]|uniref:LuxR C-terminal-related transcriptional regulator n=1 Tax=Rhizobium TaxID=379 RepID=UPI0018D50374|nr:MULTISPECIES: LuxR family transcriptional regulator [Rhizobium]UIJ83306.1 helix-turn-helix transcriptional regulator [Rhizobium leguminosarum]WSG77247.1 LuxR family transcriptional regulator [Rhizobium beringeri]WSG91545.1 LuxR family transcriptional regulator [Rhizobium beringeri]WSH17442.1 LuxR family transcriptional regulator [Rhizobium beringeri]WSH30962.1 LuxR family transcriptional regulator [Rhizobium beringeri]